MKKVLSVISVMLILLLLTACNDIIRPATETEPHNRTTENTVLLTETLNTEWQTELENTTSLETEVTTDAETTASVLGDGEKIVYGEDGQEYIEGSQLLFGEETTVAGSDTDAFEDDDDPYDREEKYPVALMYHCINEEPNTKNTALFVRPSEFEAHCQVIKEMDLDCLFADEFGSVEKDSVILTFDDGYEDNYTYMFPIIKKYNIKVTVYMIAYKIDKPGYLTREQIKEMSDSGLVQFGSHTLDHPSLVSLDEEGVRKQMEGSNWIISQITGKSVTTIAYPGGDYNNTVMNLADEIYKFAYTTDDDPYWGQRDVMLPRYAILRGMGGAQFRIFVQ